MFIHRFAMVFFMLLPVCFLAGCHQVARQPDVLPDSINAVSKPAPSINDKAGVHNPSVYGVSMALLWFNAGKKQGLTPEEMDSLQKIISLRKKF